MCSPTSGSRRCVHPAARPSAAYPDGVEMVFSPDPAASSPSFDRTNATAMSEATERIGLALLYNDHTRVGWTYADDDGSFLIRHANRPLVLVPASGGGPGNAGQIANGTRLLWRRCPTDCVQDFTREEYLSFGFVFEDAAGAVCLPAGV